MSSPDYITIGIIVIVFIFELIIIWYIWWCYNQSVNNFNDVEDMIYNLYRFELIGKDFDFDAALPKRVKDRIFKKCKNTDPCQ